MPYFRVRIVALLFAICKTLARFGGLLFLCGLFLAVALAVTPGRLAASGWACGQALVGTPATRLGAGVWRALWVGGREGRMSMCVLDAVGYWLSPSRVYNAMMIAFCHEQALASFQSYCKNHQFIPLL